MTPATRRLLPALALPLLALAFLALVALSAVALRGARLDLTDKRLYTLSDGTARIIGNIDEPVHLKLYYSERSARDLPQFRVYAQRVIELLQEVAARSNGKVSLEIVDPEPFSDAEDEAAGLGLQAVPLGADGNTLYFGLVGRNSTDGETTMPFIQPDKEQFLEYDLAKLISTLAVDTRPVVALLSDLPTGPGMDPITGQPSMGWVVDRQLAELFELRRMQPGPSSIADDVDLLMLVHPRELPQQTLMAIDQFVLRGGRLLVFVDPDAESDSSTNLLDPASVGRTRGSDLPELFGAWGIQYDPTKVVLDSRFALQVPGPDGRPIRHLPVLGLGAGTLNQKDVVSADLEALNFSSAGAISLAAGSTLEVEPLVQSSPASALADAAVVRNANSDPRVLSDGFKPDGKGPYLIAARLTGLLKTAFPEVTSPGFLRSSTKPVNIIVVADTDVLSDRLWVSSEAFLGQPVLNPFANNGDFAYNAVDNLVGNAELIAVRTRVAASRPFLKVEALRRGAEQRFRVEEKQLQEKLLTLEGALQKLQPATNPGAPPAALTREQQAELQRFQQEKLTTRKALRDVQHQLNADIDQLGMMLRFLNILAMPLLIVCFALAIAYRRMMVRHRDGAQPVGGWDWLLSLLVGFALFVLLAACAWVMGMGGIRGVALSLFIGMLLPLVAALRWHRRNVARVGAGQG